MKDEAVCLISLGCLIGQIGGGLAISLRATVVLDLAAYEE